ncbi:MAG: glycosyl hydrolase family 17 protein [Candidatus Hydrogenedentota bacterium]
MKEIAREANYTAREFKPFIGEEWLGHAISYGPFRDGQEPGQKGPTEGEILSDLQLIGKNWKHIRLYDSSEVSELVLKVIRKNHLPIRVMLGVWIAPPDKFDWAAKGNKTQVENAVRLAKEYSDIVIGINVGNETQVSWSFHRTDRNLLLKAIRAVRNNVTQPVTTADDYNFWNKEESRSMAEEVDFIVVHLYAMWNGQKLAEAIPWMEKNYSGIQALHPGKMLVIGEAGWATTYNASKKGPGDQGTLIKGEVNEKAQKAFYEALSGWIDERKVTTFWFEAFDENWKGGGTASGPLEVEKHWGLYTADRKPKLAAQSL